MEKLTIKELAPYLPYGLKIKKTMGFFNHREMVVDSNNTSTVNIIAVVHCQMKPILRPLSDLTKEIEVNGYKFVPIDYLNDEIGCEKEFEVYGNYLMIHTKHSNSYNLLAIPHEAIEKLFEWHFDVFGLIEKELAIDLNTIK